MEDTAATRWWLVYGQVACVRVERVKIWGIIRRRRPLGSVFVCPASTQFIKMIPRSHTAFGFGIMQPFGKWEKLQKKYNINIRKEQKVSIRIEISALFVFLVSVQIDFC